MDNTGFYHSSTTETEIVSRNLELIKQEHTSPLVSGKAQCYPKFLKHVHTQVWHHNQFGNWMFFSEPTKKAKTL